jgi:phosphopantothenoylcysteine decarboxylase/phosphopantothenate--cysteine ligase
MAKFAAGIADDVVCASALALPPACRRLFCPSMNTHMWQSDAVQGNVRRLEADGWRRIGPGHGTLACGVEGEGRMSEPADILSALEADLRDAASLAGRRVLILSGPTREPLDPVRYLGNASSGRMGRALALEALARGAEVEFVTGPVEPERLPRGPRLRIHPVGTAAEMLAEARPLAAQADVLVFAAAVADYAPARPAARKAAKSKAGATLALNPTPDIAATLAAKRRPGQVAIGFALETDAGAAKAAAKCRAKRLDGIVLNGPASMGADAAEFHYLAADAKSPEPWGRIEKGDCARRVLARAAELLAAR